MVHRQLKKRREADKPWLIPIHARTLLSLALAGPGDEAGPEGSKGAHCDVPVARTVPRRARPARALVRRLPNSPAREKCRSQWGSCPPLSPGASAALPRPWFRPGGARRRRCRRRHAFFPLWRHSNPAHNPHLHLPPLARCSLNYAALVKILKKHGAPQPPGSRPLAALPRAAPPPALADPEMARLNGASSHASLSPLTPRPSTDKHSALALKVPFLVSVLRQPFYSTEVLSLLVARTEERFHSARANPQQSPSASPPL